MRYYEDLDVGTVTVCADVHHVTEAEIMRVGREWDPQPMHTDPEAAASLPFGTLVASTVHLLAIAVKMGVEQQPIATVSGLGLTNMVNHAPVRPGDRLRKETTILERRLSNSRPGEGLVTFRSTLINDHDEVVFSYEGTSLIRLRPI